MKELNAKEILYIHYILAQKKGLPTGLRDIKMLKAAILRPHSKFRNKELYPDIYTKAAALTQFIIRGQPFNSANTSTGITIGIMLLQKNSLLLQTTKEEILEVAKKTANNNLSVEELGRWFEKNSNRGEGHTFS